MNQAEWCALVEQVKRACVQAAVDGYRDASMAGLCHEGAFEAAISAIQMLDPASVAETSPNEEL